MVWLSTLASIAANAFFITLATAVLGFIFNKRLEEVKKETAIHILKYQTLHVKRAEAIEAIYTSLEKSIRYMGDVMSPGQRVGGDVYIQRVSDAEKMAQEFKKTYSSKRIYLQPTLAKQLGKIDQRMMFLWLQFARNHPKLNPDSDLDFKQWDEAWNAFTGNEIPTMLRRLEKEFRALLGSDSN